MLSNAGCRKFVNFETLSSKFNTLFNKDLFIHIFSTWLALMYVPMPSAGCFLNWRHHAALIGIVLQLIFSVPLVLLYSAYWVFPESSRWLLANGRVEEAEDIVREIARCAMS